jgi:hypothetical protein
MVAPLLAITTVAVEAPRVVLGIGWTPVAQ